MSGSNEQSPVSLVGPAIRVVRLDTRVGGPPVAFLVFTCKLPDSETLGSTRQYLTLKCISVGPLGPSAYLVSYSVLHLVTIFMEDLLYARYIFNCLEYKSKRQAKCSPTRAYFLGINTYLLLQVEMRR